MNFDKCMYLHFSNPQQDRGHFQNRNRPPCRSPGSRTLAQPKAAAAGQLADVTAPYSGTGCAPGARAAERLGEPPCVLRVSTSLLPSPRNIPSVSTAPPTPLSAVDGTPSCSQVSTPAKGAAAHVPARPLCTQVSAPPAQAPHTGGPWGVPSSFERTGFLSGPPPGRADPSSASSPGLRRPSQPLQACSLSVPSGSHPRPIPR